MHGKCFVSVLVADMLVVRLGPSCALLSTVGVSSNGDVAERCRECTRQKALGGQSPELEVAKIAKTLEYSNDTVM